MSVDFLTVLFWSCAIAVVVSQVMILRSTVRAWRTSGTPTAAAERAFAIIPAIALAAVLYLSWTALA